MILTRKEMLKWWDELWDLDALFAREKTAYRMRRDKLLEKIQNRRTK